MEAPQQQQFDWSKLTHVVVTVLLTTVVTLQNMGYLAPMNAPAQVVAQPAPAPAPAPCPVLPHPRAAVPPVAEPDAGSP